VTFGRLRGTSVARTAAATDAADIGRRAGRRVGGAALDRDARTRSRERWFYLLISPWLIGLVLLQVIPLVGAVFVGFTRWERPLEPRWVGLDNLAALLGDARFGRAVQNTIVYAVGTVVPGLLIGLGLALVLGGMRRGGGLIRATVFMPAILAGVATALLWGWVLNPRYGLLDGLLAAIGVDGPAWLRDPTWAMPAMIVVGLWNVGINVVVYLAALTTVPHELHDAAALDGAGPATRFRYVTWPALLPITFYLAIVNLIAASQVFTPTYVLTAGGPDDSTLTTALYLYQNAFEYGRLGYASAMAIAVFLGVAVLTALAFRAGARRVAYLGADT
jgi:multiple sugar transport system permease protein